ncbi:E3 ubiquitin-protein ligase TRIM39-like [Hemitrygon akajei]|uniref:E3 ubiquitin-protein ligase TRIM39-like n=1 Tax=Hemitrygon akajei TaxID=2704970 RepID=UPI003BF98740
MENNLQNIKEYLTSSQLNISKLQERIQMQDSITYLKEEACGTRRISEEVREMLIKDGTLTVKKLDHARMLKAMLSEEINCTSEDTASVTLDVETAHPRLEVSEDRKSVRWIRTSCSRPDTGRRFIFGACVLGSEGFKSGRHYWEVVVRSNRRWALGVAAESVERNGRLVLKPHNGTWAIGQTDNKMYAYTTRRLELPAEPIPQRVGVLISYEAGTVSFYNVVNKSLLYTFSNFRFAEKLYPFFRTLDRNWLTIGSGSILNV